MHFKLDVAMAPVNLACGSNVVFSFSETKITNSSTSTVHCHYIFCFDYAILSLLQSSTRCTWRPFSRLSASSCIWLCKAVG